MVRTSHVFLPSSGTKISSLRGSVIGSGYGTVLLDGGKGGQSSYNGIDDYIEHTGNKPKGTIIPKGEGLADKITSKLQKLNIKPPTQGIKRKNITLSI